MNKNRPQTMLARPGATVLHTFIDALSWESATKTILDWASRSESRVVCLCNVHSSVTATDDQALADALASSDMVLPDGAPVAWMLRRKGYPDQRRIAGPDLMLKVCHALSETEQKIFLFGSSPETLDKLTSNLRDDFPSLQFAGALSPRFGDWTEEEQDTYIKAINESGAGIIFIGLGCPKQEIWMACNKSRVKGVMLGVGAAFDFHAGTVKRAPEIFQKLGMEWLHRLLSEPRRLWKRYLSTNTRFLMMAGMELLFTPKNSSAR